MGRGRLKLGQLILIQMQRSVIKYVYTIASLFGTSLEVIHPQLEDSACMSRMTGFYGNVNIAQAF